MMTHPLPGRFHLSPGPTTPSTLQSTPKGIVSKSDPELLWENENSNDLLIALATHERDDAKRRLTNAIANHNRLAAKYPCHQHLDPTVFLSELEYIHAKETLRCVEASVAYDEAILAGTLIQSSFPLTTQRRTPPTTPKKNLTRENSASSPTPVPSPFPALQRSALNPPTSPPRTPKNNLSQSSNQHHFDPTTPTPTKQFSSSSSLGSPYHESKHYSIVCGRRVGVYSSW